MDTAEGPSAPHLRTGAVAEDAVAAWYRRRGFQVVSRNWRCRIGEIDVVARRGGLLVFCEVKARRGCRFGGGHEAVGWRKQQKLRSLAEVFLLSEAAGGGASSVRFDVASVVAGPSGVMSINVFEDAF